MKTPDFTVILVNWNTADLLLRAIDSVESDAAWSDVEVEVIVVDNGSWDESVKRVRDLYPAVNVIENGSNLGFSRAVNKALAAHQGKHVILLNTDAVMEPGTLKSLLATFESHPQLGIIGANLVDEDGSPQNSIAPFPSLVTETVNKGLLRLIAPSRYKQKVHPAGLASPIGPASPAGPGVGLLGRPELIEVDSVIGACLAIRGETLAAVGPLDERFFFFFEETDWCYQAHRLGWKVAVAPAVRVVHSQGKSSEPVLADVRIEFHRSRYRYFLKNKGKVQTILLFEAMLVKLTVETVAAAVTLGLSLGASDRARRRLSVVSKVLAWHIRGCPRSWGLEGNSFACASEE